MSTRTILIRPKSVKTAPDFKSAVTTDPISFVKTNSHPSHFKTVKAAFKKMISPIYGDQTSAIAKIKESRDRICEIMLNYDNPLGIIVYKNQLQTEYGLEKALELKTLFLFNPDKNSGNGYGSRLFERIDEVAEEMGTKTIYCTASSKVENSIKCAIKNGYLISRIVEQDKERTLYLMIKDNT